MNAVLVRRDYTKGTGWGCLHLPLGMFPLPGFPMLAGGGDTLHKFSALLDGLLPPCFLPHSVPPSHANQIPQLSYLSENFGLSGSLFVRCIPAAHLPPAFAIIATPVSWGVGC